MQACFFEEESVIYFYAELFRPLSISRPAGLTAAKNKVRCSLDSGGRKLPVKIPPHFLSGVLYAAAGRYTSDMLTLSLYLSHCTSRAGHMVLCEGPAEPFLVIKRDPELKMECIT